MDQSASGTTTPADVATAVAGARLVGAPTSDKDDEWRIAARAAIRSGREIGARVVLGDASTRSFFKRRMPPAAWPPTPRGLSSGEGPVGRDELELLGLHYLVEQLDEAAEGGVEAEVWLATQPGIRSLPIFLERFPDIDVMVVPPLDHRSRRHRRGGDTIERVRARFGGRTLILADSNGRLTVDRPDPKG